MSSLGGQTIARIYEAMIPPGGGWLADFILETGPLPTVGARLPLVIGDLTLAGGTVLRAGFDVPDQARVTVAGGGGWRALLARASYQSGGGVRLSTVLRDLASIAREPYDAPPDTTLGNAWGWPGSEPTAPVDARAALAALVRHKAIPTWRVPPSGTTSFARWPKGADCTTLGRIVGRDLSRGMRRVELDTRSAPFLPGATIEGATIRRVVFREESRMLTVEAWES